MTSYFDKLGLSPQERRLVVIVGIVVFVVLNWWVVLPMFGEWGRYEQRIKDTRARRDAFDAEIRKRPEYETRMRALESQGHHVPSEEAALRLQQEVISQANLTGLGYGTITPGRTGATTKTNAFFDEAVVNVSVNTGEKELIDFLVRLADKEMLIRAKSMDIGPDPSQMRLQGNLTLVKSFQRKPPPRSAGAPGAKPAATTPAAPPTAGPAPAPATPAGPGPGTPAAAPRPEQRPGGTAAPTNPTNPASASPRTLPKQLK